MTRRTHKGRRGYPKQLSSDWGERLSAAAAFTHTDSCVISAPDAEGVFDPDTGEYAMTPGAVRYFGKCRVSPVTAADVQALVTGQDLPDVKYRVSVEYSVNTVQIRDVITVTSGDPMLIGQKLYVWRIGTGSQRVTRELFCTDDQSF